MVSMNFSAKNMHSMYMLIKNKIKVLIYHLNQDFCIFMVLLLI